MVDNTRLPLGTEDGDIYASDDVAGVKYQRIKVTLGADGANDGDVSSANPIPVKQGVHVIDEDTTTTALLASTSWTSKWFDAANGAAFTILVSASHNGSIFLEESPDQVTVVMTDQDTYSSGSPRYEASNCHARYFRFKYTNGGTNQTSFLFHAVQHAHWSAENWLVKLHPNYNSVQQAAAPWEVDGGAVTPSLSNVAQNDSSVTLVTANAATAGFIIHNDSEANLYVKLGATASAGDYTWKIRPDEHLEWMHLHHYVGTIDGIWSAAGSGNARVTVMSH